MLGYHRICRRKLLALAASTVVLVAATPSLGADLVLKRVLLGTGGVGYFEYAADVDASDASLQLRARLDQVDDILKSLIVIDPAGTATVTLPGKAGASEAFASLPFAESDLESLPALVGALKGASVSVEAPRKLTGSIVSAVTETVKDKDGNERQIARVSLLNGATVEQFVLEDAEGLKFDDPRVGAQVETALKALRAAHDRSGRDIAIRLAAGGKRSVRLGYVAEAPVWKAAYRLSLPEETGGKARLQGWAVLENMTGTAWTDVELTLISGSPVTFREALYDPYYVRRQTVAPPVSRLALPRTDQGQFTADNLQGGPEMRQGAAEEAGGAAIAKKAAPRLAAGRAQQSVLAENELAAPAPSAPAPTLGAIAPSTDSAEHLSGATFSLSAPVNVMAGESVTLPFIDTPIAAGETAWIQSGSAAHNPWHAVSLTNSGDVTLPAGSVTLYETTSAGPLFAGEAQLNVVPPAQKRLIAFGDDQKIRVDREPKAKGMISEIILAKAMITVKRLVRDTTVYRLTNDDSKPRKFVVDHPRADGLTLASPPLSQASLVSNAWRFSGEVAPSKTEVLEVSVDHPIGQTVAIGNLSRSALTQFLAIDDHEIASGRAGFAALLSQIGVDEEMKSRLEKIADAADALEDANRRVAKSLEDRKAIVADQARLRENLRVAPGGSDLAKLATRKLLDQEALLENIDSETKSANAAAEAARAALEELAGKAGAQELQFKNKAGL
jgi:Domain of unknown function (DUF4139)